MGYIPYCYLGAAIVVLYKLVALVFTSFYQIKIEKRKEYLDEILAWQKIEEASTKQEDKQTKAKLTNAFGQKFRYIFNDDNTLDFIQFKHAHSLLKIKENLFDSIYSFFSLHGHPSYLSLL